MFNFPTNIRLPGFRVGLPDDQPDPDTGDWLRGALWPYGALGAFVASLLWVMARLERAGARDGP